MSNHPPGLSDAAKALLARRAGIHRDTGPHRGAASDSAPLASPQLGQWISSQIATSGPAGALPKTLRLEGRLDREALRRALAEIMRRHAILRTVFSVSNGEPVQQVTLPPAVDLREVDLRRTPTIEREAAALLALDQDARRPFDLGKDPLMRPLLVRLEDHSYELQVTFQHVAFDGWSNGIYLRELGALYSAFAAGRDSPLPDLPLQYADFAVWERAREVTTAFEVERAYWRKEVSGSTTALDLAGDRPRRHPRTQSRVAATTTIEAALAGRLSELARAEGTTLFAVAFAAFQVLVGRRAGLDDFVLGAVSANRPHRETEALIGSFMAILPIRTRLDDATSFRSHLRRSAESLTRGLSHQGFPFQRLMADLRPGGDPGVDRLYDVVFNYRNMPLELPVMEGLAVSDFRAPHLGMPFDFHLNVTPDGGGIALELDYNPDVFGRETAARWLAGYRAVLEAVAVDPDASTALVSVMPAGEQRLLLEQWSGSTVPSPPTRFVMDQFEAAAKTFPNNPAIEHDGSTVSYGALRTRMRGLASRLRHAGVGAGDLVGLFADPSVDTIVAMLATLSIGAVYVPLEPRTPERRLEAMLEHAGVRLILTDRAGALALSHRRERTASLSDFLAGPDPADESSRPARVGEQDAAYVIFTSGSTGPPKGVVVPHGSLARYIATSTHQFGIRPGDRQIQFSALTFDVSIREILIPLGAAASLVLRPEGMLDSPAAFVEHSRALRLTHVSMPTAFWAEIARSNLPGGLDLGPSVRVVTIGGEAATADSVRRFFQALARPARLFNSYGPTETTIGCTQAELSGSVDLEIVPIGRPFPGVTAYVLDERRVPVPIGVPGELWIGGDSLAAGYLDAPELTSARFVSDPFSPVQGARLYRTGDRVRWLADGQLTFMGRKDFQVKVRGHRVELQEIERVLGNVAGVRQAAVIHEDDRLIGFVAMERQLRFSAASIREAMSLQLPPYMVPAQIVELGQLPLGVTGKVDRQRLGSMVPASATTESAGSATITERMLAKIWEAVLGVIDVGLHDRFLDLGGHSILAMRMANRVREELGVDLTIGTVLAHPTVATLAREVDRMAALVAEARHH